LDRHGVRVGGKETGEVVVGRCADRLQLQRRQILFQRLGVELLLRVDRGEVVVGVGGARIELDRLLELLDRLVEPPPLGQLDPPGVVLVGPDGLVLSFRVATHRPQITRKGGPGLPPAPPCAALISRLTKRCTSRKSSGFCLPSRWLCGRYSSPGCPPGCRWCR